MKLSLSAIVVLSVACGSLGGCSSSTDAGGFVRCTPGKGFTACIPGCSSTAQPIFEAGCDEVGHYFFCSEPWVPAASCPRETWPSGPNAACGPLVQVNGCNCPVCTGRIWTCQPKPCPDAGSN